jgi:hypothetical protein
MDKPARIKSHISSGRSRNIRGSQAQSDGALDAHEQPSDYEPGLRQILAFGQHEEPTERLAMRSPAPFKKADQRFYPALLQSDHWKKRRLAILKTRGQQCIYCGKPARAIHHERYDLSVNPWEYDTLDLTPICHPCHNQKHTNK